MHAHKNLWLVCFVRLLAKPQLQKARIYTIVVQQGSVWLCAAAHPDKCCAGYARPRGLVTVCRAQKAADNVVTVL